LADKSITATLLWDRFGIGVSGICTIHCLIFPVIISVLPLWPAISTLYEWLHPAFIVLLIPIIYFASRRNHFDFKVTLTLITGFLFVLLGWLIGHLWLGVWFEVALTFLGSTILIIGHWFNFHHHRHCNNSRHRHHPITEDQELPDEEISMEEVV
jgi:hypothetical protein